MQLKSSLALIVGLTVSVSAQTVSLPTSVANAGPASSVNSKLVSDLSTYQVSLFNTIPVSLATAYDAAISTVTDDIGVFPTTSWYLDERVSVLNEIITGQPTWLAGLPTDVQSYIKSAATAEASIINHDINAGTRVDAVVKAGVAAAVGIAAGVVIML